MKKLTNLTGYCFRVAGTVLLWALLVTTCSLMRKLQKKGAPRPTKEDREKFRKEYKK